MTQIAIAAGTQLAADAGAWIAQNGGNAVDATIAATFATWVCEPGLTSLGSGGYCTVWGNQTSGQPITIDGFVEMPGRTADPVCFGNAQRVNIPYGGASGVDTIIGPGSIGTPGSLAAVEMLWKQWGRLPWKELLQPAIDIARRGFPLSKPSHVYFNFGARHVLGETPDALSICLREDGSLRTEGEVMTAPDLAVTLENIRDEGADALYVGDLGKTIARWIVEHGGLMGLDDLRTYRPLERTSLTMPFHEWRLASNPHPAVGGAVLIELAAIMSREAARINRAARWTADEVARFAKAMHVAFDLRLQLLKADHAPASGRQELRRPIAQQAPVSASPSTSHTSTVDSEGLACAITTSTGYSSGVVVPGTGVLLNNMLGELELSPRGLHSQKPGERLRSNMSPSIARSSRGDVLSFGAAGAERIASSLAQTWLNIVQHEMNLQDAVAHPRCHLEWRDGHLTLAHEPHVDVRDVPFPTRAFDAPHMFFGGVQAALRNAQGELVAAGDPRRNGGSAVVGGFVEDAEKNH